MKRNGKADSGQESWLAIFTSEGFTVDALDSDVSAVIVYFDDGGTMTGGHDQWQVAR